MGKWAGTNLLDLVAEAQVVLVDALEREPLTRLLVTYQEHRAASTKTTSSSYTNVPRRINSSHLTISILITFDKKAASRYSGILSV